MRKISTTKRILVGLLVATLILGTFAGVSLAAGSKAAGSAQGFVNGCRGFFGGAADQLAKLLGLKPEQIIEKRNAGESLADIAKDQGVSQDKVVTTMLEARKKLLDAKVKAGVITKDQEQAMLDRMKTRIQQRIQDPTTGGGCGGLGRGGCGMGGAGACSNGGGRISGSVRSSSNVPTTNI